MNDEKYIKALFSPTDPAIGNLVEYCFPLEGENIFYKCDTCRGSRYTFPNCEHRHSDHDEFGLNCWDNTYCYSNLCEDCNGTGYSKIEYVEYKKLELDIPNNSD